MVEADGTRYSEQSKHVVLYILFQLVFLLLPIRGCHSGSSVYICLEHWGLPNQHENHIFMIRIFDLAWASEDVLPGTTLPMFPDLGIN